MANRPVKIKRYRSVGASGGSRRPLGARLALFVLCAAALFGVGWLVASGSIDSVTDFWYKHFSVHGHADSVSESVSAVSDTSAEAASSDTAAESDSQPADTGENSGTWGDVALSALSSEDTLRTALSQLAEAGVDHAVVTLKDERGYVYYNSAVELAVKTGAVRSQADVAMFVRVCGEYGIVPCARLVAFRDPLAAGGDRSIAVHYQTQDILWLDSSLELGGQPWLNPYADGARQYVLGLAKEVAGLGIRDVVLAGVQFPQGNGLDLCGYGADTAAVPKTDALRECVALFDTELAKQDVSVWFEWPETAAVGEGLPAVYGDGGLAALGAGRILLTLSAVPGADGAQTLPQPDAAALKTFADAAQKNGTQQLGLSLSAVSADAALSGAWRAAAHGAGFTHFAD